MAAKLSVVFYILLCLEVGIVLTLLPWYSPFGLGDWGSNYFLLYAAHKTGLQGLQHAVSSGWFRGAVTGLGLLNLGVAVWEIAHFNQTVRALQTGTNTPAPPPQQNVAQPAKPNQLSDNERRDDIPQQPVQ
jgi:hypothetical protein